MKQVRPGSDSTSSRPPWRGSRTLVVAAAMVEAGSPAAGRAICDLERDAEARILLVEDAERPHAGRPDPGRVLEPGESVLVVASWRALSGMLAATEARDGATAASD